MQVVDVVEARRERFGMPVAELSRRTGIEYQALNNALSKKRGLSASELVLICKELGLDIEDFDDGDDD